MPAFPLVLASDLLLQAEFLRQEIGYRSRDQEADACHKSDAPCRPQDMRVRRAAPGNTTSTPKSEHTAGTDGAEDRVARAGHDIGEPGDVLLSRGRLDELSKVLRRGKSVEQMPLHDALLPPPDQTRSQIDDPTHKGQTRSQNDPILHDAHAIGIHVAVVLHRLNAHAAPKVNNYPGHCPDR